MFSTQATELGGEVQFKMTVVFPTIEATQIHTFSAKTKNQAHRIYAKICFDILQVSMDELQGMAEQIKPHFFDTDARPNFEFDRVWPAEYWKFLELRRKCSRSIGRELYYAEMILEYDFSGIIPQHHLPQRNTMIELAKDIRSVASQIKQTINFLIKNDEA